MFFRCQHGGNSVYLLVHGLLRFVMAFYQKQDATK